MTPSTGGTPTTTTTCESPGSSSASGSPGGDVTLRIAYIGTAGTFNGPEGYAHSKGQYAGWLASAGVKDVKAVEFANGPLATQALVGGSVDVIIAINVDRKQAQR